MQRWGSVLCLMTALLYISNGRAQEWSYDDQATWGDDYPLCNAEQQSPIDLDSDIAETRWSHRNGPNSIDFEDFDEEVSGSVYNIGYSVEIRLNYENPSRTPRITMTDNGVSTTYIFQRDIHFHWPSEHVLDGERYPLEMHMLHQTDNGQILVLIYLYTECRRSTDGLEDIGEAMEKVAETGAAVNIREFAPDSIMPLKLSGCDYFQYNGSYTTPPCTEGVTWLVYREPLCIGTSDLKAFQVYADAVGPASNSRLLQPLNGRTIINHRCI